MTKINDFSIFGYYMSYGDYGMDFVFTIPTGATNIIAQQSIDGGVTWTDSNVSNIWIAGFNGVPRQMIRISNLNKNQPYLFKLLIIGGQYEGESNIVSAQWL